MGMEKIMIFYLYEIRCLIQGGGSAHDLFPSSGIIHKEYIMNLL